MNFSNITESTFLRNKFELQLFTLKVDAKCKKYQIDEL